MLPVLFLGTFLGFATFSGVNSQSSASQCSRSFELPVNARNSYIVDGSGTSVVPVPAGLYFRSSSPYVYLQQFANRQLTAPFAIVFKFNFYNPAVHSTYSLLRNVVPYRESTADCPTLDLTVNTNSFSSPEFGMTINNPGAEVSKASSKLTVRMSTNDTNFSNYFEVVLYSDDGFITAQVTEMGMDGQTRGSRQRSGRINLNALAQSSCGLTFFRGVVGIVNSFSVYEGCNNNFMSQIVDTSPDGNGSEGILTVSDRDKIIKILFFVIFSWLLGITQS